MKLMVFVLFAFSLVSAQAQFQGGAFSGQSTGTSRLGQSTKSVVIKSYHAPALWEQKLAAATSKRFLNSAGETDLGATIEYVLMAQLNFPNVKRMNCLDPKEFPLQIVGELDNAPKNEVITCKNFESVALIIRQVDQMLGRSFISNSVKRNLSIVMVSELNNAFYYPPLKTIFIPKVFFLDYQVQSGGIDKEVKVAKHPNFLKHIIAHEYGHYIYDNNYQAQMAAYDIKNQRSCEALDMIRGVNEVVADMISVTLSNDPQGVAKSLYHTGLVNLKEDDRTRIQRSSTDKTLYFSTLRDFSNRENDLDRISTLIRARSPGLSNYIVYYHNYFAPVRNHSWKYYLSNPEFMHDVAGVKRSETVKALISGITNEIIKLGANKPRNNFDPSTNPGYCGNIPESPLLLNNVVNDNAQIIAAIDLMMN